MTGGKRLSIPRHGEGRYCIVLKSQKRVVFDPGHNCTAHQARPGWRKCLKHLWLLEFRVIPGAAFWVHNGGVQTSHYVQDCSVGEYSLVLACEITSNTHGYWGLTVPILLFLGIDGNHGKMPAICRVQTRHGPDGM